ncbi:hypothetical protein [Streptosporangium sp. NPDC020145]|uniref:hypothetical protein n=1 Tax=Streptosporangium sp. NPDC020145 TaxID=3154694 RepID=UPI00341C0410
MDAWTVEDAVALLHPPLTAAEVREMIDLLHLQPYGSRRTGRRGRPAPTYDPTVLQHAHALVMRGRVDLARIRAA